MADGITLKGTTDKTLNWVDSTDSWTSSENIDLAANKKFTVASNPVMCPVGMLAPFAGASAPDGWLLCAGQAVSRSTYAALFAVVSTTYGSGDGSTTFNLPDLRGRTAVGKDDMGGSAANRVTSGGSGINGLSLGGIGGSETHTLTSAQSGVPAHQHANTATFTGTASNTGAGSPHTHIQNSHQHSFSNYNTGPFTDSFVGSNGQGGSFVYSVATGATTATNQNESAHTHPFTPSGSVTITNVNNTSANASQAHNNIQPSIILNYIIKH